LERECEPKMANLSGESMSFPMRTANLLELRAAIEAAGLYVSPAGRMTPADTAAWLGVSERTLRRMREEGRGPHAERKALHGSTWSYAIEELIP